MAMSYKPVTIEMLKEKTLSLFEDYGVEKVAVFGSCARNEMRLGSDIDLLVQLPDMNNPLLFVELKRKLENKLRRKVDLISYGSLISSRDSETIMADLQVIYEKH